MRYQSRIESYYPRYEASEGSFKTINYITDVLRNSGIAFDILDFTTLEHAHSFSNVVVATIPGKLPDTLVVAVPINHGFATPENRDGSATLALALALATHYKASGAPLTMKFVFLGAERPPDGAGAPAGTDTRYPLGTRLFLQTFYPEAPVALVYLDFPATSVPLVIQPAGSSTIAPDWLLRRTVDAARASRLPFTVPTRDLLSFRLGKAGIETPVGPYLDAGIPAIALEGGTRADAGSTAESTGGDTGFMSARAWYEDTSQAIEDIVQSSATGFPSSWDRHYLVFRLGGAYRYIGEQSIVLILLVSLGAGLLIAVARRRIMARYARTVLRNAWNLPVLLGVIFLFLWISTLLVNAFLRFRGFPTIWEHAPALFFGLKISLSILLSMIVFRFLHGFNISRNGSFYSASALIFLLSDVGIASVINISFASYFLVAFFFAFLFSSTRIRILKLLFLLASPILIIKAGWDILSVPQISLIRPMLISPIKGNLLLAFITLPFLLMVIRMDFLIRHPVRGRRSFAGLVATILAAVATLSLSVFVFTLKPYAPSNPQPVTVTESIDEQSGIHKVTLDSPARLDGLRFIFGTTKLTVPRGSGRTFSINVPTLPNLVRSARVSNEFLDRVQTSLELSPHFSSGKNQRFLDLALTLESSTRPANRPLVVYDLSLPYSYNLENHTVSVYVGVNPPNPLSVEYTIPGGEQPSVVVHAWFRELSEPLTVLSTGYRATTVLSVMRVLAPEVRGAK